MRFHKYLIIALFLLFSIPNFGQSTLLGKVTDEKGKPIPNVIVYLDTIRTDAKTNVIGYFKVDITKDIKTITLFSSTYGYLTSEYNKEERLSFMFLEPKEVKKNTQIISENNTKKENSFGETINQMNVGKDDNASNYNNIYEYIDGRVAGVSVVNSNEIVIRGGSSWELSNEPLFVVDGIVVHSIGHIRPIDVVQINVLKGVDASIYGSRGSNGVIEITTSTTSQ